MHIKVNDETVEVPESATLEQLVAQLALAPERLAIELNREVVRRADWPRTSLSEADRVEIVHFVGGGSADGPPSRTGRRFCFTDFGCKFIQART